jgi:hypothetical protein
MPGKHAGDAAAKRARYAAAARALLERRGGAWVTSLDLARAGVTNPRQAIADLRRAGVDVDEHAIRGYAAWRLREQLPHERDAPIAREPE